MKSSGLSVQLEDPSRWGSGVMNVLRGMTNSPIRAAASVIFITLVVAALFAPVVAPYDPLTIDITLQLSGPSLAHPLGTDEVGRDLLSNILFASRISLTAGAGATALGAVFAVPLGLLAGFWRGPIDDLLMRLTDSLFSIPGILLALTIVAAFGTSMVTLMMAIGVTLTPGTIRIVRASALVEREKDYVLAANALGASGMRIMVRHILPNISSAILIQLTLGMTIAILIEAFMSYVGLGVQPPYNSLGTLLSTGYGFIGLSPWYVTFPGIFIFSMVWSLNVLGDAIRDSLDPRLRSILS
ncbi:MAG: ABC transporter permease [Chloroflexi bacterium]|nr:ABC transporter permease [Chloroflexota bacterium]